MRVHVDTNVLTRSVKVYIMDEVPDGRYAFLWPEEYTEFGWVWKRVEEASTGVGSDPRPALEMSMDMWQAFTKALLESEHVRVDALDIIAKTLEREQGRVDKLLGCLVERPMLMTTGEVRQA